MTTGILYHLISVETGRTSTSSYLPGLLATYDSAFTRSNRCIVRRTSWRGDLAARERAYARDQAEARRERDRFERDCGPQGYEEVR